MEIIVSRARILEQAKFLAHENRLAEPAITKVYWFPDDEEVRLVEVLSTIPPSGDRASAYYFRPAPGDDLPAPSGIAMIRPEEFGRVILPANWGNWEGAIEISVAL